MSLSAGRVAAIQAIRDAFAAADAETDPEQKAQVQTDIATGIVDSIITLLTTKMEVTGTTTAGAPNGEHTYGPSVIT